MADTERDARRDAAIRGHASCPKCGGMNHEKLDGSRCDGFPGITYRICQACGYEKAIVKRQPKPRL